MATLNISLPQSLKDYAQDQVATREYSTPSDYVRSLIREDKNRDITEKKIESLLLEGLESGKKIPTTPIYWEKKRLELLQKIQ